MKSIIYAQTFKVNFGRHTGVNRTVLNGIDPFCIRASSISNLVLISKHDFAPTGVIISDTTGFAIKGRQVALGPSAAAGFQSLRKTSQSAASHHGNYPRFQGLDEINKDIIEQTQISKAKPQCSWDPLDTPILRIMADKPEHNKFISKDGKRESQHNWHSIATEWLETYPSKVFTHKQLKQKHAYAYKSSFTTSSTSSNQSSRVVSQVQTSITFPSKNTVISNDETETMINENNDDGVENKAK